jgi:hypothetical protein
MLELKQRLVFDVESYFADVLTIKKDTEGLFYFLNDIMTHDS